MSLEFIHVHKNFTNANGTHNVLEDINLKVSDGEFVCILGPSGCGKTTLLNMAAGFTQNTSGSIIFNGKEVAGIAPDRIMLFQESALFPWLNVLDNVAFGLKMSGVGKRERENRAVKILELVHLADTQHLHVHQLSGGMKQRVALARALVMDSEILLMDEPFSALDHFTKAALRKELLRIWMACNKTILFVTHDVDEAILLADKIVVITAGPGKIKKEIPIPVERHRRNDDGSLKQIAATIKEEFGIARGVDEYDV
jgi:NitT/TauT family transport system ATP-binding protein